VMIKLVAIEHRQIPKAGWPKHTVWQIPVSSR
jgi:hypothetical protein